MTAEYLLEILNGSWSILSFCFLIFLAAYLIGQYRENNLTWRDWWSLPLGMMVAISLFIQTSGSFSSRITVWIWRHFQGGGSLTSLNINALTFSAFVAAIGILMMMRVFSMPRYGNWPWVTSALLTLAYILSAVYYNPG